MEEKDDIEVPEPLNRAIQEGRNAEDELSKILEEVAPQIQSAMSSVVFPARLLPIDGKVLVPGSPNLIQEENAWKRHTETLKINTLLFSIQKQFLEEQKKIRKENRWLSGAILVVSIVTLITIVLLHS